MRKNVDSEVGSRNGQDQPYETDNTHSIASQRRRRRGASRRQEKTRLATKGNRAISQTASFRKLIELSILVESPKLLNHQMALGH
jgi:hypothetical protein